MLLPGFLDLIPDRVGKLLARILDWHPEGKHVILRVTEGEPNFYGTIVSGKIINIEHMCRTPSDPLNTTISILIQLDSPWHYSNRTTTVATRIIVEPKFRKHSVNRLIVGSMYVFVFPVINQRTPFALSWEDMIAICDMKLTK